MAKSGPDRALIVSLMRWASNERTPLVLLIDEIDALAGGPLVSVLRQLRTGYDLRPEGFPQSIALCGLRDVRDYRTDTGSSPFNIKAESLRLGDFSESEVAALLGQHTAETGQLFSPEALDAIWNRTQGQPWLVNALAREACFKHEAGRDRSRRVGANAIAEAQERLILSRQTHLDQLADKLKEGRVRRVIEPLLSDGGGAKATARDIEYVRELGLIARDLPLRIANPIYAEVVPRELTAAIQELLLEETAWYVRPGGGLDVAKLLAAFQAFFREHSEHWVERMDYKEAGPQLLLQAFLQRIVNGGGRVEREYGLGRGRTDLLIVWPQGATTCRIVIECKVRRKGLQRTIDEGVEQTAGYMARCTAEAGHLVVLDRDESRSWGKKLFRRRERSKDGVEVEVWGM